MNAAPRSSLVVIRTRSEEPSLLPNFRDLAEYGDADLCLALDISAGLRRPTRRNVIPLSTAIYQNFGLPTQGENPLWKCGDYALYVARAHYPNYRYYWLIEDDVFVRSTSSENIIKYFQKADHHVIGMGVIKANPDWYWTKHAMPWFPTVWKMLFPVVRITSEALDLMLKERRRSNHLLSHPTNAHLSRTNLWPNDEAFVASLAKHQQLSVLDINAFGREFYNPTSMGFNQYLLIEHLEKQSASDFLYHSALTSEQFLTKMQAKPHLIGPAQLAMIEALKRKE